MMGKDLAVTLAGPINIHRRSPFDPMHWQDLSSLNNPELNPQPLLAAALLNSFLLNTEAWETLLAMSH